MRRIIYILLIGLALSSCSTSSKTYKTKVEEYKKENLFLQGKADTLEIAFMHLEMETHRLRNLCNELSKKAKLLEEELDVCRGDSITSR